MRIIAGSGKGRKLFSPPSITRPTSDRAREGLFSSLISTFSTLEGLHFLDLFAGSGAVGVEALSRGAALVEAVESNAVSATVCEQNFALLANLPEIGKFRVYPKTAFEFLNQGVINNSADILTVDATSGELNKIFPSNPVSNEDERIDRLTSTIKINKGGIL